MYSFPEVMKASTEYYKGDILAASTVARKYLVRNKENKYVEKTPYNMHVRLAKEFTRIEKKMNPRLNEETYYNKVFSLLDKFTKTVPQGSPMAAIGNAYQIQSASNCFVVASPKDNWSGIMKTGFQTGEIQKRRGGVGIDLDNIRPFGAKVNNAALTSTGTPAFSDLYSTISRLIGQKGRQGALMLSLSAKHIDAERFATMKQDQTKVTGANISLKLTDDFMRAVDSDSDFTQQWPVDVPVEKAEITKTVKAAELWKTIVNSAWLSGEPGLLMWDNYCKMLPAHYYPGFKTLSTNPCAELGLSANDSCRLISQNLYGWVKNAFTKDAYFDFEEYYEDTKIAQRMSDGLVELEIELIDKILEATSDEDGKALWNDIRTAAVNGRRTGLGTHGLADVFLALGIRYDSDEAIKLSDKIYYTHMTASYDASMDMAEERGPFPIWDYNIDIQCPFIVALGENRLERLKRTGRRNIANTTLAPTGSVAIASRSSSGMESVFRWVYDRYIKNSDEMFPVDRVDVMGDKWTKFRVVHPAVEEYFKVNGIECDIKSGRNFSLPVDEANKVIQKMLPDYFVTSDMIDYNKGIELQSTIQKYIDHGISRTINLPKGTPVEAVGEVYLNAWKMGLKGVTVYVDGSRDGVLITTEKKDEKKEKNRPVSIIDSHSPKRPKNLPADIHQVKVKGEGWAVVVGLMQGRPFEIFAGRGLTLPKSTKVDEAFITKKGSKKYALSMSIKENVEEIADIREIYDNPEQRVITKSVCMELRHGIPIEFIIRNLQDYEGSMVDYTAVLARVLKKYISRPGWLQKVCPSCGGTEFAMVEGCSQCTSCGHSKCN